MKCMILLRSVLLTSWSGDLGLSLAPATLRTDTAGRSCGDDITCISFSIVVTCDVSGVSIVVVAADVTAAFGLASTVASRDSGLSTTR